MSGEMLSCDVSFFPECVYFCQLKICTKSPPGLVVRTWAFTTMAPHCIPGQETKILQAV